MQWKRKTYLGFRYFNYGLCTVTKGTRRKHFGGNVAQYFSVTSHWLCTFCFTFVDTVDEKRLREQMQALKKEKNDALTKMTELQKQVSYK